MPCWNAGCFRCPMLFDLRFALRSLLKSPGFAAIAVLTLALGIGASTSIFSVLRALVLAPFSYPDADRVVEVWENDDSAMASPDLFDLSTKPSRSSPGGLHPDSTNFGGDKAQSVPGRCLHRPASSGPLASRRPWAAGSSRPTRKPAPPASSSSAMPSGAVVFRRPSIVGRTIRMNGSDYTVIGVMPRDFEYASPWMRTATCQLWMPLKIPPGRGGPGFALDELRRAP